MLTKRRQHGHDDDEESDKSVEDFDRQLQRAALLTPHAAASAATPCRDTIAMVKVSCACNYESTLYLATLLISLYNYLALFATLIDFIQFHFARNHGY